MTEYRQDDRTDRAWCPLCGEPVTTVYVDASGWCSEHGRVFVEWNEPRVPATVRPDDRPKSREETRP